MLIGLAGFARSGKSTAAGILEEYGFVRLSFADPVRSVVYESIPDVRRIVDAVGWEQGKAHALVRRSLQDVGTAIRRHVDADALVDAAFRWMEPDRDYCLADVRFKNEGAAIIAAGGQVIRIDRPGVGPVNQHASEVAMVGWDQYSRIILNHGTVTDLAEELAHLVGRLQCR